MLFRETTIYPKICVENRAMFLKEIVNYNTLYPPKQRPYMHYAALESGNTAAP